MNPLDQSIQHWEQLLTIAQKQLGQPITRVAINMKFKFGDSEFSAATSDCAMCRASGFRCDDCLVYMETWEDGCKGTPYAILVDILDGDTPKIVTERIVQVINDEVNFLKSLKGKYDAEKNTDWCWWPWPQE